MSEGTKDAGKADLAGPTHRRRESVRLVWNTKPKKPPNPRELEFQPAEIVYPNKAAEGGQEMLFPRTPQGEVDDTKMNRLIWGDNLLAMQALLAQGYAGKIQLIYIDPPFLSSSDYSHKMKIEGAGDVVKAPSILERLAYKDTWIDGDDSYFDMLYPRLILMRELLSDTGTIYVHLGPNVASHVTVMMDEIFGKENWRAKIIWQRTSAHSDTHSWGMNYDEILVYNKSSRYSWNPQYLPYSKDYVDGFYRYIDPSSGRRFRLGDLTAAGSRTGDSGKAVIINGESVAPSQGRHWALGLQTGETVQAAMDRLIREDRVQYSRGKMPAYKRFLDEMPGVPIQAIVTDIPPIGPGANEDTGFDTQKPVALVERIIKASSNEGDLVADFFHGSGTTGLVAEKLGRRWICTDLGKVGVQITRARLVAQGSRPFVLENIGNYQRELIYREGGNISLMQKIVMRLYGAKPHPNHADLGVFEEKGVRKLVYVGYPDRPLTAKKTAELVKTARSLDGEGYDKLVLLAWDYEYNYDQNLEERRRGFGVDVEPRLIPPSIYEYLRKSKNEDDLQEKFASKIVFGAKPYLKLGPLQSKALNETEHNVAVAIDRYVLAEIPVDDEEDRAALQEISHGDKFPVLIDYWAVDWDYDGKTFRSRWQDFRGNGKNTKVVGTRANTTLAGGKKYDIAVRVVDVFGNDATATTSVDLR
ncbi:MAG: site-specific DNA-methyltransferase [Euryarchaeota archaeon]|nr:site-specific DNA-methyltransferase [Euryarchaeota archaeon]